MPSTLRFIIALLTVAAISTPLVTEAGTITGTATVTDGDTIKIDGRSIRLEGIDTPEKDQVCINAGQQTTCGNEAGDRLRAFLNNRQVTCDTKGIDKYCRTLAVCSVEGIDINGWMVREGLALAYEEYTKDYVPQQNDARTAQRGLWRGAFVAPWDFRHYKSDAEVLGARPPTADQKQLQSRLLAPLSTDGAPSLDCIIKGNVNDKGNKIYHLPGTFIYSRINMSKPGVRWFCSEAEAQAAGWRAVKAFVPDCTKKAKANN